MGVRHDRPCTSCTEPPTRTPAMYRTADGRPRIGHVRAVQLHLHYLSPSRARPPLFHRAPAQGLPDHPGKGARQQHAEQQPAGDDPHRAAAPSSATVTRPVGTTTSMPAPYPTCVSVGTRPTAWSGTPNVRAISGRSGWL